MLEPTQVPMEIAPDEELGRRIRSSRYLSIPKHLFIPPPGTRLSVDRLSIASAADAMQELIQLAEKKCAQRERTFYGWAVLTAAVVRQNERRVVASPEDDNPYHADIVLPEKVADDQLAINRHAQELADAASLHKISPSIP